MYPNITNNCSLLRSRRITSVLNQLSLLLSVGDTGSSKVMQVSSSFCRYYHFLLVSKPLPESCWYIQKKWTNSIIEFCCIPMNVCGAKQAISKGKAIQKGTFRSVLNLTNSNTTLGWKYQNRFGDFYCHMNHRGSVAVPLFHSLCRAMDSVSNFEEFD